MNFSYIGVIITDILPAASGCAIDWWTSPTSGFIITDILPAASGCAVDWWTSLTSGLSSQISYLQQVAVQWSDEPLLHQGLSSQISYLQLVAVPWPGEPLLLWGYHHRYLTCSKLLCRGQVKFSYIRDILPAASGCAVDWWTSLTSGLSSYISYLHLVAVPLTGEPLLHQGYHHRYLTCIQWLCHGLVKLSYIRVIITDILSAASGCAMDWWNSLTSGLSSQISYLLQVAVPWTGEALLHQGYHLRYLTCSKWLCRGLVKLSYIRVIISDILPAASGCSLDWWTSLKSGLSLQKSFKWLCRGLVKLSYIRVIITDILPAASGCAVDWWTSLTLGLSSQISYLQLVAVLLTSEPLLHRGYHHRHLTCS